MAYTRLSVTATPGKPYSFTAKTEAPEVVPEAGPHTGLFTELSVTALPGQRHSFSAKTEAETPAAPSGDHTGLFTALSVLALPGMRHSFSAKTEAEAAEAEETTSVRGYRKPRYYELVRDDEEMLEIIKMMIENGMI